MTIITHRRAGSSISPRWTLVLVLALVAGISMVEPARAFATAGPASASAGPVDDGGAEDEGAQGRARFNYIMQDSVFNNVGDKASFVVHADVSRLQSYQWLFYHPNGTQVPLPEGYELTHRPSNGIFDGDVFRITFTATEEHARAWPEDSYYFRLRTVERALIGSSTTTTTMPASNPPTAAQRLHVRSLSPSVTQHPADVSVQPEQAASFSAAASGNPHVQWQSAPPGGGWSDVPGATSWTHTIPSVEVGQHGTQFRAVFSNSAGSVTTNPATLSVLPVCAPVELPRVSGTGPPGGRARLAITGAEGGAPASGVGRVVAPSGTRIVGVDSDGVPDASFTVSEDGRTAQSDRTEFPGAPATVSVTVEIDPGVASGTYLEDGQAQVLDDGGCPVVGVGLTVAAYAASLEVVQQPQDQVVYAPRAAVFTAGAEADAGTPVTVRWQVRTAGLWVDVPGATAETLRVEHTRLDQDQSRYRAVFSTLSDEVITDEALLTVLEAPPVHLVVTPRVQLVDALPSGGAVLRGTKGGPR